MTLLLEKAEAPPEELPVVPPAPPSRRARRAKPARTPRPPLPPRPPAPAWADVLSSALVVLGVLCLWTMLQFLALGGLQQARAQNVLHAELREQLAGETAPLGGAIEPGVPVALLEIPTLGLRQVVVEGTSATDLRSGPGHLRSTVLPGQEGRSMVYGRVLGFGGPFRSIATLREGDGITVTTGQGEFVYRVDGVRRQGDPLPAPPTSGEGQLVLVTAEGSGPLAGLAPSSTVLVDATLVDDAVGAPAGRPGTVPPEEKAMNGDAAAALPPLVLGLQGVLVMVVVIVWARRRFPGPATWVLLVPPLLAAVWFSSDAALRLLPNLL